MTVSSTIGFSGFGQRNALTLEMLVVYTWLYREYFVRLSHKFPGFKIVCNVYDMQPKQNAASGTSLQPNCDAIINGSLDGPPDRQALASLEEEHPEIAKALDLRRSVAAVVEADHGAVLTEFAKCSPVAPEMLRASLNLENRLDTSRECVTRGFVGKVHADALSKVVAFAAKEIPFLEINIHHNRKVESVDLTSDPLKPAMLIGPKIGRYPVDFLELANGTTWRRPVSGDVAKRSFSDVASQELLNQSLVYFNLLDKNGILKHGTRFGIGGLKLSANDFVPLILSYTNILKWDEQNGLSRNEEEARKYGRLFLFFSRHPGEMSPPRHSNGDTWNGVDPICSTEEFHALWMHKDHEIIPLLDEIALANVAATLKKMPDEINAPMTTHDRAASYREQNAEYHRSVSENRPSMTEVALYRSAVQSFAYGSGLEKDPAVAGRKMEEKYPITHTNRSGWPIHRALTNADSRPGKAFLSGNARTFKCWEKWRNFFASAPVVTDVDYKRDEDVLSLGENNFHLLIAPRELSLEADDVHVSLADQVQGTLGRTFFRKGRILPTKDGKLSHATDSGMSGHGARILNSYNTVANYWLDTTSRASAIQLAPIKAKMLLAACILRANGDEHPYDSITAMHRKTLDDNDSYQAEIAPLGQVFKEIMRKVLFKRQIEKFAKGNGAWYADAFTFIHTPEKRKSFVSQRMQFHPDAENFQNYIDEIERDNGPIEFRPLSRKQDDERYVDYTATEIGSILEKVMAEVGSD
ncbi:hypothetical protein M422DRAFT_259528 [Sphaerobolus stellatus SS14]|uniref:Uncharacterized protein n=1 Tax=Sphaerobolus stellatus (strain SS14) TaxID=990650 RepID=A0A0C9V8T6_SPHS4|nr:hypothetical protein M422DRAFT_259528 [Sphaerobolus stellatus SS14]